MTDKKSELELHIYTDNRKHDGDYSRVIAVVGSSIQFGISYVIMGNNLGYKSHGQLHFYCSNWANVWME